ncbi:hypothetical protein [Roseibium sp.]|uniref:hypothetical protein n=1 Tax=Roseibium sp. TaxID=1936156 RepID=UPI003D0E0982
MALPFQVQIFGSEVYNTLDADDQAIGDAIAQSLTSGLNAGISSDVLATFLAHRLDDALSTGTSVTSSFVTAGKSEIKSALDGVTAPGNIITFDEFALVVGLVTDMSYANAPDEAVALANAYFGTGDMSGTLATALAPLKDLPSFADQLAATTDILNFIGGIGPDEDANLELALSEAFQAVTTGQTNQSAPTDAIQQLEASVENAIRDTFNIDGNDAVNAAAGRIAYIFGVSANEAITQAYTTAFNGSAESELPENAAGLAQLILDKFAATVATVSGDPASYSLKAEYVSDFNLIFDTFDGNSVSERKTAIEALGKSVAQTATLEFTNQAKSDKVIETVGAELTEEDLTGLAADLSALNGKNRLEDVSKAFVEALDKQHPNGDGLMSSAQESAVQKALADSFAAGATGADGYSTADVKGILIQALKNVPNADLAWVNDNVSGASFSELITHTVTDWTSAVDLIEKAARGNRGTPGSPNQVKIDLTKGLSNDDQEDVDIQTGVATVLDDAIEAAGRDEVLRKVDTVFTTIFGNEIGTMFEQAFSDFLSSLKMSEGADETFSHDQIREVLTNALNSISDAQYQALVSANGGSLSEAELDTMIDNAVQKLSAELSDLISGNGQVFRFYNTMQDSHFYTASTEERDSILANLDHFQLEGVAFTTTATSIDGTALHRFYNQQTTHHFFTTSDNEKARIEADLPGYAYEGVAMYVYTVTIDDNMENVARLYNTETGKHLFTASDAEEQNAIESLGFTKEGDAFFANYG